MHGRGRLTRGATSGRDRVQPTGRPGMASEQPSYGEDATSHRAMGLHCLQRVRRARRVVATHIPVQRTDHRPIGLEQADENVLHRAANARARHRSRSPARVALDAPPAGRSARITTRHDAGSDRSRSRIRCRSWRRVRLRATAPPTARPTISPTRGVSPDASAGAARACTTNVEQPALRPDRTTVVNSSLDRMRTAAGSTAETSARLRPPGAGDPFAAGSTALHGPLAYACADGNRASCADAGCWAETYACSLGTAPDQDRCARGWPPRRHVTRWRRLDTQARAQHSRRTQSDRSTIRLGHGLGQPRAVRRRIRDMPSLWTTA
jgi:hypothetical protein